MDGWSAYEKMVLNKLENLEQAVDTIALEMERVSESQRYLTRVLTEQRQALGAGNPGWMQGDKLPVPEREPVPVRRAEG